jgi:predicted PurR-regulated permease PerM
MLWTDLAAAALESMALRPQEPFETRAVLPPARAASTKPDRPAADSPQGRPFGLSDLAFVKRVLIVLALGALAALAWRLADVLLLAFGAVVVAVILRALADVIAEHVPATKKWSLALAGLLIVVALAATLFFFGRQVRAQLGELARIFPPALDYVLGEFGVDTRSLTEQLPKMLGSGLPQEIVSRVASYGVTLVGALADVLLVVVAGVFLAADPSLYKRGLVALFPTDQHERVESALDTSGVALRLWLKGQLIAMALVGVLTGLAVWLIGVPSPIALGMVAAVGEFIPFVGPILAAVPALVIAASQSTEMLLWTAGAFVLIQQIESNLISPLIQHRTVELPPVLSLLAVLAFATVFGPTGLVLAVPLTVVFYVLVKKLYVRETLGEATHVPGEAAARGQDDS